MFMGVLPALRPSWPGLARPSTSLQADFKKDVDARDKPGHDECGWLALFARHCHGIEQRFKPKTPATFGH
jgi:hypothetical protein